MTTSLNLEILKQTPLFKDVEPWLLEEIQKQGIERSLKDGEILFASGTPYQHQVFLYLHGPLEIKRYDGEVRTAQPGYLVGLANYLDASNYTSSATANGEVELLVLADTLLRKFEAESKAFFNAVNQLVLSRIREQASRHNKSTGPLSGTVRSAMQQPVSTCSSSDSVSDVVTNMQQRRIGSVGVVDSEGTLTGLLTYKVLCDALIAGGVTGDSSVSAVSLVEPQIVAPDSLLWQVAEIQEKAGTKYVVVLEHGNPVGIVSQTDILRVLVSAQHSLLAEIQSAQDINTLTKLSGNIWQAAKVAYETHHNTIDAVRSVSELHSRFQRRCVELTLSKLVVEGYGDPPKDYALIIMGSGGRQEMMLGPDQDNGIILADSVTEEDRRWFVNFSERLNINLDLIGYELCKGDIMARNPMFHKTLAEWKQQLTHLVERPNEKAARWSNIFFDFDTLYGNDELVVALRRHLHSEITRKPNLLGYMVMDDAEGRPPIGLFNQLITANDDDRKGKIDIKRNGLRIIADAARIFALSMNITACNTNDRLMAFVRSGRFDSEFIEGVRIAFNELLDILLDHQIKQSAAGVKLDKLVDPNSMPPQTREALRLAMRAIKRFQDKLQSTFDMPGF